MPPFIEDYLKTLKMGQKSSPTVLAIKHKIIILGKNPKNLKQHYNCSRSLKSHIMDFLI
jgi:hypothetical protein